MKERPILFSGPMVRAILDGRKTMTRRVVKPQSLIISGHPPRSIRQCPYGAPGDRLWVRETFAHLTHNDTGEGEGYIYRADGWDDDVKWKPSIFMPRWASRITLEITDVRVERLQDITNGDAITEGVWTISPNKGRDYMDGGSTICPCGLFRSLWEKINGRESWDNNPWVWVIEFRKITA